MNRSGRFLGIVLVAGIFTVSTSAGAFSRTGTGSIKPGGTFTNPVWYTDWFQKKDTDLDIQWQLGGRTPNVPLQFDFNLPKGQVLTLDATSSLFFSTESVHIDFDGARLVRTGVNLSVDWTLEFTGASGDFVDGIEKNAKGNPILKGNLSVGNQPGDMSIDIDFIPAGKSISFTDLHLTLNEVGGAGQLSITQLRFGVDGNNAAVLAAPVPEPQAYALMLAGLGAVGLLLRKRRRI